MLKINGFLIIGGLAALPDALPVRGEMFPDIVSMQLLPPQRGML